MLFVSEVFLCSPYKDKQNSANTARAGSLLWCCTWRPDPSLHHCVVTVLNWCPHDNTASCVVHELSVVYDGFNKTRANISILEETSVPTICVSSGWLITVDYNCNKYKCKNAIDEIKTILKWKLLTEPFQIFDTKFRGTGSLKGLLQG